MTEDELERFTRNATQDCAPLANAISKNLAEHMDELLAAHAADDNEMKAKLAIAYAMLATAYWTIGGYPAGGLTAVIRKLEEHSVFVEGQADGTN